MLGNLQASGFGIEFNSFVYHSVFTVYTSLSSSSEMLLVTLSAMSHKMCKF